MRLATGKQAILIDQAAQAIVPAMDLMEEAGSKMAEKIIELCGQTLQSGISIVCGPGNNGGDGLVVARKLKENGYRNIQVYLPSNVSTTVRIQEQKLRQLGVESMSFKDFYSSAHNIIIDGIFGVGLSRDLDDEYKDIVVGINFLKKTTISLDVPTGLDCTNGRARGVAVRADYTLAVAPSKVGFYLRQGPEHCGKIYCISISFPRSVVEKVANRYFLLRRQVVKNWWPQRLASANKSDFGRSYLLAGSTGKWGAAVLALRAAFKVGCGYVVHVSQSSNEILSNVPEAMTLDPSELIRTLKKKPGAIGIGPGSGFDMSKVIEQLKKFGATSVVLDADALTLVSKKRMQPLPRDWIVTPHTAELSRLIDWSTEAIEAQPLLAVEKARSKWQCHVLFKGFHTIVASSQSRRMIIVPTGNVSLAKAGTGDVLTGLITGLLAQKVSPLKSALLASYVHGLAGDLWTSEFSSASLAASDLIDCLPRAIRSLEK